MMPGVTTRKPRVNCLLCGRLTALTVCQAISIAIRVVLPAPVASFSAGTHELGIGVAVRGGEMVEDSLRALAGWGATSVSQMVVSTPRPGRRMGGGC